MVKESPFTEPMANPPSKQRKTAKKSTSDAGRSHRPGPSRSTRPPRKRGRYHHGDLPRALVKAALELISKEGGGNSQSFTLREAARVVGVTHGAAYRHFKDKTALLAVVAEEGFRELNEQMETARTNARASAGPREVRARIQAIGGAYVRFALERQSHFRVMFGPNLDESGRFPALEAEVARSLRVLLEEVEPAAIDGLMAPGKALDHALALWTMTHGYASLVLMRKIQVKPAVAGAYFAKLFDSLLDGVVK